MAAESELETMCRELIEHAHNGKLTKVKAVADNGFPDRLVLIPGFEPVFAEFKAPNGKLSPRQKYWRDWLVRHGFMWMLVDDFDWFAARIKSFTRR